MDKYVCEVCDWVYDPEVGDPDGGIAPGTPFEELSYTQLTLLTTSRV